MQYIIEAAIICLLEPRKGIRLSKFGILEAYVPAKKIKVLAGTTTLASIMISGLEFLKLHGILMLSEDRLLGRCQFINCNTEGMIYGFGDLFKLSPQVQNNKLEVYNLGIKNIIDSFLAHFLGLETFHLRAERDGAS